MAEKSNPATTDESPAAGAPARSLAVDVSGLNSNYINFCRVTGTPEEVIIDFGLSTDPAEMHKGTVIASDRVILSFYTAKRLLEALNMTVGRHETAFGTLELNVDKRVVPGFRG